MKRFFLVFPALLVLLALCSAAFAEDGYVRLAINGTNVNLRPQPRAGGSVVAQMNTGDVFFAEEWPITCTIDDSLWYKIVLPAPDSGAIKTLRDWDSRFKANVAFVNANFVTVSPLKNGDMGRIEATPVGEGYWAGGHDPWVAFQMEKAGFMPFYPAFTTKNATDIYRNSPINDNVPTVIGRHERGADVWVIGIEIDSDECLAFIVADPSFRKPAGWVVADDISVERYEMEFGDFDFIGFQRFCILSVGGNLPEIYRKWHGTVERRAFEFFDEYVIYTSFEGSEFQVTFYEYLPQPDGTPNYNPAPIRYFQTLSINNRDGASFVGGIHIGHDEKNTVQKLLGEPSAKNKDEEGESWNWSSEFSDLYVNFDNDGIVSSMSIQARAAD